MSIKFISMAEGISEVKLQKKEAAGARSGRKVAKHCVFPNVLWLQKVEK